MERKLLHTPEGVRDVYNGECEDKLLIQERIHNVFKMYGYMDIQTPSFEFFDIFNKERGSVASKNMFKFFDREGNTLVLRPDMTPAIARCAAKYFENENNAVRLCYTGNTFINNSSYQGRLKETTQVGAELIGDSSIEADAEILAMMVEAVISTGLEEFQVEVGHVGFFKGLVEEAGFSKEAEAELRDIIRNKNIFRVEEILQAEKIEPELGEVFYKLPQFFGDIDILSDAETITANKTSLDAVEHLKKVYELLKIYGYEKYITFDLGMLSEHDYYTGVVFQGYTYNVGEPFAKGGRYDKLIEQFGTDKASIGFGLTADLLHMAIMRQKIKISARSKGKLVVYSDSTLESAIKLVKYFRNSGIMATLTKSNDEEYYSRYDDVISADDKTLERYGIR